MEENLKILNRYTIKSIAERFDPEFAKTIQFLKEELPKIGVTIFKLRCENQSLSVMLKDCRNELCERCGNYKEAHRGACNGCRWEEPF